MPPVWYKSAAYRSRAIAPRGVLREFGTQIDEDVEVRAWDSTAELRYIVIPERPADTENLSEAELAELGLPLYLCGGACSLHQKVKRVPDNFGGKGQSLEVVLIQEIFIASRVISNLLADNE